MYIIYLSPSYDKAIIGSPNYKYIYIISKEPNVKEKEYEKLLKIASLKGFDISKIIKTKQDCFFDYTKQIKMHN